MRNNSKWKGIQDVQELEKFLIAHPNVFVYDSRDRESRYTLRTEKGPNGFVNTVDGRSVRAIYFKLLRHSPDYFGTSLELPERILEGKP